jgi:hypothetical protein
MVVEHHAPPNWRACIPLALNKGPVWRWGYECWGRCVAAKDAHVIVRRHEGKERRGVGGVEDAAAEGEAGCLVGCEAPCQVHAEIPVRRPRKGAMVERKRGRRRMIRV